MDAPKIIFSDDEIAGIPRHMERLRREGYGREADFYERVILRGKLPGLSYKVAEEYATSGIIPSVDDILSYTDDFSTSEDMRQKIGELGRKLQADEVAQKRLLQEAEDLANSAKTTQGILDDALQASKKASAVASASRGMNKKVLLAAGLATASLAGISLLVARNRGRNNPQNTGDLQNTDRSESVKKSWKTRKQKYGPSGERL